MPMSATTAPTPNVGSASDTAAALLESALSDIFVLFTSKKKCDLFVVLFIYY
jgi:hypothetical protein